MNDLTSDGVLDLVVGSGEGTASRAAGYTLAGTLIREWAPFDPSFTGGVFVG